jgi:hypothetical protein
MRAAGKLSRIDDLGPLLLGGCIEVIAILEDLNCWLLCPSHDRCAGIHRGLQMWQCSVPSQFGSFVDSIGGRRYEVRGTSTFR